MYPDESKNHDDLIPTITHLKNTGTRSQKL